MYGPERCSQGAAGVQATYGTAAEVVWQRRGPFRHLKRWLRPALETLDRPRPMLVGWFSAGGGGVLFHPAQGEEEFRYVEAGLEP